MLLTSCTMSSRRRNRNAEVGKEHSQIVESETKSKTKEDVHNVILKGKAQSLQYYCDILQLNIDFV